MLIINNLDEVFAFIEKQAEKDMEKALQMSLVTEDKMEKIAADVRSKFVDILLQTTTQTFITIDDAKILLLSLPDLPSFNLIDKLTDQNKGLVLQLLSEKEQELPVSKVISI
jgi:hypothetical protein